MRYAIVCLTACFVSGCGLDETFRGHTDAGDLGIASSDLSNSDVDLGTKSVADMAQPATPPPDMALALANFQIVSATQRGRYCGVAGAVGNTIVVASGTNDGVNGLTTVETASLDEAGTLSPFGEIAGVVEKEQRDCAAGATVGSYVYLFSGLNISANSASVTTGTVERTQVSGASLSSFSYAPGVSVKDPRYGAAIATSGDTLYILGGANENGTLFDDVQTAHINADGTIGDFSSVGHLAAAVVYASAAVVGHYLYVFGGKNAGGPVAKVQQASIDADGSLGSWALASSLPTGRVYGSSVVVGQNVYLIGGTDGSTYLPQVDTASVGPNGLLGAFTTMDKTTWHLATLRASPMAVAIGHTVIVIGGYNATTTAITSVERAVLP